MFLFFSPLGPENSLSHPEGIERESCVVIATTKKHPVVVRSSARITGTGRTWLRRRVMYHLLLCKIILTYKILLHSILQYKCIGRYYASVCYETTCSTSVRSVSYYIQEGVRYITRVVVNPRSRELIENNEKKKNKYKLRHEARQTSSRRSTVYNTYYIMTSGRRSRISFVLAFVESCSFSERIPLLRSFCSHEDSDHP